MLDFWLISDVCQEDIEGTDIIPSINSDHSAIILHFNDIDRQKHGGAKVQVTGCRSGHRPQATGHRSQATGHRSQATGQVTGYRLQVTGHTVKFRK